MISFEYLKKLLSDTCMFVKKWIKIFVVEFNFMFIVPVWLLMWSSMPDWLNLPYYLGYSMFFFSIALFFALIPIVFEKLIALGKYILAPTIVILSAYNSYYLIKLADPFYGKRTSLTEVIIFMGIYWVVSLWDVYLLCRKRRMRAN